MAQMELFDPEMVFRQWDPRLKYEEVLVGASEESLREQLESGEFTVMVEENGDSDGKPFADLSEGGEWELCYWEPLLLEKLHFASGNVVLYFMDGDWHTVDEWHRWDESLAYRVVL